MTNSVLQCLRSANRFSPRFAAVMAAMVTALSLWVHCPTAVAQSYGQPDSHPWHLRFDLFQMLLEQNRLTVTTSTEDSLSNPLESVVVLLGDQKLISHNEWRRLRRFVDQGGSLLVASEQNLDIPGLCSFRAGDARTISDEDRYLEFADCLRLTDINSDHVLTNGVGSIVVNRTGWLTALVDDSLVWEVIVSLPDDCSPQSARGQAVILAGLDPAPDRGVMILAADKSLFSNGMLWHGDNAVLAIRMTELLCRGQRTRLSMIVDGVPLRTDGQNAGMQPSVAPPQLPPQIPPNINPPEPDLATMMQLANAIVDDVQRSNIFNEALRDRPRNMRPVAWLRTVLLVLLVLAILYVLWRLVQNRALPATARQTQFMQSMYGVHSASQIATSEFGTTVEVLARDLCREITGSSVETDWIRLLSNDVPSVASLPRSLQKGLSEVLSIAIKGCRVHLSKRKFQAIGRVVQELRTRHRSRFLIVNS